MAPQIKKLLNKKPDALQKVPQKESIKTCCKGFFIHGGLLTISMLYGIVGAYIMIGIETPEENRKVALKESAVENLRAARDYIVSYAWYLSSQPLAKKDFEYDIKQKLDTYHVFVVKSAVDNYYDGRPGEWNNLWTFPKTFLFTFTTIASIGYGHITPVTQTGQLFSVYYAMLGIPLLLLFLANFGELLAKTFRYIYSRLCCRWCRIRRFVSDLKKKEMLKPKVLWKEQVGSEEYMPTNHVDVPIIVNLCVIFVYVMMGGILFSYWENWSMSEAIYFTFITLATIGFGDYVPGNSFSGSGSNSLMASFKMIVTVAYCLFGMALVSMAINLMQEQLVSKTKWLAHEIGLGKDAEDPSLKYQIKKHEPGTIHETPPDKDGNQTKILDVTSHIKAKKGYQRLP